jgi:hypothetical protein
MVKLPMAAFLSHLHPAVGVEQGNDAKHYQVRAVRMAIEESKR